MAESTALRTQSGQGSRFLRRAYAGEEFRWLVGSWDRGPARVIFHPGAPLSDTAWVDAKDTYIEWPLPESFEMDVHLSLLEVPAGVLDERIPAGRYLERENPLPGRYWVDATFAPTGRSRFGIRADMYKPGRYFLYDKEAAQRTLFYDSLFASPIIRPLYHLSSVWKIATIHERLVLTRRIVDRDHCYESHFLRTESRLLVDTTRTVDAYDVHVINPISTSWLWNRTPDGEVGGITLTYYLEITPTKKMVGPPTRRIARSILLGWASCL